MNTDATEIIGIEKYFSYCLHDRRTKYHIRGPRALGQFGATTVKTIVCMSVKDKWLNFKTQGIEACCCLKLSTG